MTSPRCTLSIFAARTDMPFLGYTIPHLVRMCRYNFVEKVLVVDTAPLSGDKLSRPGIGTLEELRALCAKFVADGIIDRVIDINYDPTYQKKGVQKTPRHSLDAPHPQLQGVSHSGINFQN